MSPDVDTRVERLLDQLEDPTLTPAQVEMIKRKLEILKEQQS